MFVLLDVLKLTRRPGGKIYRGMAFKALEAAASCIPYAAIYLGLSRFAAGQFTAADITTIAVALIAGLGLQFLCAWFGMAGTMMEGYRNTTALRTIIGDHLRRLPLGYFMEHKAGALNAVIVNDVTQVENIFTHKLGNLVYLSAGAMLVLAFLMTRDWQLALVMAVSFILAAGAVRGAQAHFAKLGRRTAEESAEAISRMLEYVQGIKVIRAYNLTAERFERLASSLKRLRALMIRIEATAGTAVSAYAMILEIGFAIVAAWGTLKVMSGDMAALELVLFLILSIKFFHALKDLGLETAELKAFTGGLRRVEDVMHEAPLPEAATQKAPSRFDIRFDNVTFAYGETPVLGDLSFSAPQSSVTALVGPSGSGKTTITNLIARFHDVNAGAIRIGGVDIREIPSEMLMDMIGIVFQDVFLFNDTVLANIALAKPGATVEEIEAACRLASAHDFIMALPNGYQTIIGEDGGRLSGGERQRLSIARAILKNAPILLLDEATASLDAGNEQAIQSAFETLKSGKTVVVIAHKLTTIQSADRIIVLDNGRIAESGAHSELLAVDGTYASLWAMQQAAAKWSIGSTRERRRIPSASPATAA